MNMSLKYIFLKFIQSDYEYAHRMRFRKSIQYKLHFKERILPIIKHLYQLCLYFPIMFYLVTEVVSTLFTEVKEKHNQIMLCCEQCFGVRSCSWFVTCQSIYGIRYFNYCIF